MFFTAFAFTVFKTLVEHTHSRLRKANMESTFTNAGYYDTKATDGRPLRIIFPFDDSARTKQIVIDTIKVLEAFAAKCTAGAPVCFSPCSHKTLHCFLDLGLLLLTSSRTS
jgi:hypothetical protein